MVEVIGFDEAHNYEVSCWKCASRLKFSKNDRIIIDKKPESRYSQYGIECPTCKQILTVA